MRVLKTNILFGFQLSYLYNLENTGKTKKRMCKIFEQDVGEIYVFVKQKCSTTGNDRLFLKKL